MDFFYALLKVTSFVATGVFSALALLTKYKDAEGKITRWGKIALGGIVISLTFSLTLHYLETSRAKAKAIEEQAKATATAQKLEHHNLFRLLAEDAWAGTWSGAILTIVRHSVSAVSAMAS